MRMRKLVTQPSDPNESGLQPHSNSTPDLSIEQQAERSNAVARRRPNASLAEADLLIVDPATPTVSKQAGQQPETVTRADHAFNLADRAIADEAARHTEGSMECSEGHGSSGVRRHRSFRVGMEVFDRIAAISHREQISMSTLIERMLTTWERLRLAEAETICSRRASDDNDT